MTHKNFYKFKAENNFELGKMMGVTFSDIATRTWATVKTLTDWEIKKGRAKKFITYNEKFLPEYLEEMRGYAEGAAIPLLDMYTLSLEDEVDQDYPNKCTTFISNGGKLFAHNEDWDKESQDRICIIEKTIRELSIFELYYCNTLGGNSVSINSNGLVIGLNSLVSRDTNMGLSKNVISRWMQEVKDPLVNIETLKNIPRSVGYNYNIVDTTGHITNVEYNSLKIESGNPPPPFVHSNHYLSPLSISEANTDENGTFTRYETAIKKIIPEMSIEEMIDLSNDASSGPQKSIMNERTIAKIIVDIEKKIAKIWLLREDDLGWVDYDLQNYFS